MSAVIIIVIPNRVIRDVLKGPMSWTCAAILTVLSNCQIRLMEDDDLNAREGMGVKTGAWIAQERETLSLPSSYKRLYIRYRVHHLGEQSCAIQPQWNIPENTPVQEPPQLGDSDSELCRRVYVACQFHGPASVIHLIYYGVPHTSFFTCTPAPPPLDVRLVHRIVAIIRKRGGSR